MSHSPDLPDAPSPLTYPNALAFGGDDGTNNDDDDDDSSSESTPGSASGLRIDLSRENGHCMRLFCSAARPTERRVCACSDPTCTRMVPTSHKASVFDPSTHASAGSYTPLAPLRRGGPHDGAFASLRSFDQRQADLQRLSDQNVASANDLRVSSPETSRSFFDEEEAETLIPARGSVTFATTAQFRPSRRHDEKSPGDMPFTDW
jgi:hypothetical protein